MSDGTHIEWTDASWSPLRARRLDGQPNKGGGGWSCQRVSPGCEHCYAETINKRLGTGFSYDAKGVTASEHYLDEKALLQPLRWKRGRRIFLSSMTDVFGEWVTDEQLDRIFAVMALSPQHTFQVLTKRAERMRKYLSSADVPMGVYDRVIEQWTALTEEDGSPPWPLPNVWLGVSAEDQQRWDERAPQLLATPAAVRFVSYEPALGPINTDMRLPDGHWQTLRGYSEEYIDPFGTMATVDTAKIDWVIVGGESGPGARPFDIAWARSMVQQCQAAQVAVFVKQLGAKPYEETRQVASVGVYPSARAARAYVDEPHFMRLKSRKGGVMEEWPADLRVREMPRC